ncbi:MAG: enoyl-CoA hydratase/isomerase family protein [Candidatus Aminicenantales bacterium]
MASKEYQTILFQLQHEVLRLIFNRPQVHNAFNATMIAELDKALGRASRDQSLRVLVLSGQGKSFCAGADLNWMREIIHYSFQQNLGESLKLAEVLYKLYALPKPTVAMVNGTAIGGGTGFIAACDIAVASEEARFGLSEVKIGLVPAAISPYVIRRIGEAKAREYFLTGKRISAAKAMEIGLINEVVPKDKLEEKVKEIIELLLSSGPEALASCKLLIQKVPQMSFEEAKNFTAQMIAKLRVSEEGQEGMSAFLEKRKPKWAKGTVRSKE